jgi:cytidine deaminase
MSGADSPGPVERSLLAESAELTGLEELAGLAQEARARAYAPYSGFHVGAAVRAADGRIFTGANVENASYGLTVCAERSAILAAVLAGVRRITQVAVATSTSPPAAPCGMCRQTISEFADECQIVLANERGERRVVTLADLLPLRFRPAELGVYPEGTPR